MEMNEYLKVNIEKCLKDIDYYKRQLNETELLLNVLRKQEKTQKEN